MLESLPPDVSFAVGATLVALVILGLKDIVGEIAAELNRELDAR